MANFKTFVSGIGNKITPMADKYGPQALTGLGIACGIGAVAFAFKAEGKIKAELEMIDEPTKKDRVRIFAKHTWPIAVCGGAGIACVIASTKILCGKNATLAATCGILGKEIADKDEAINKLFSEEQVEEVHKEVSHKRIAENDPDDIPEDQIIRTGLGNDLCYDTMSGRWFYCEKIAIRNAVAAVNEKVDINDYAWLNDLYSEINLKEIKAGDKLGWHTVRDSIRGGKLYMHYDSGLTRTGRPYLSMVYDATPIN